jgi:hypothetical protein
MAAMLTATAAKFFHYTPRNEKKPPSVRRETITKRLTSNKTPRKSPTSRFFSNCWGSWASAQRLIRIRGREQHIA